MAIREIIVKILEDIRIKPISWLKAGIYALCLGVIYYSALKWMIVHDWVKEDYSHCALIPFVVLYLLWEKRREIAATPSEPSWIGFVPLGIAVCFFWLGELGGEYFTLYMSFWFAVVGLLRLHLGWQKIKTIWFALIMMLAMFPFPNFINTRITFQLRLISSKLGVWMLHLYGMSAYREGNVIDLGSTQLQVVDACSGLRYVMPLMVLSVLLAYWFKAHWWKRVVLFLSSIPLAIFVNSFRIAATGVLYSMFGAEVAEGFFHGFSGWLIFVFAIPCLLFEMWILRKIPPKHVGCGVWGVGCGEDERRGKGSEARDTENKKDNGKLETRNENRESVENNPKLGYRIAEVNTENLKGETENSWAAAPDSLHSDSRSAFRDSRFIAAVVLLLLTFGLSQGIEFRQKIPINKSFGQFPMQIGEWRGAREDMEQQFLNVLKFSDYIMVNYRNGEGKTINFYVAYYQDQRKGEAIHSPETCLPGSGWEFKEAGNVTIPATSVKPSMRVNQSFMEKSTAKELVYYWFPQRGRVLTNLYQLKLYAFWDSLTRQRTDGALVRVITDVGKGEKLSDAEARLQDFIGKVTPVLDEYIPK